MPVDPAVDVRGARPRPFGRGRAKAQFVALNQQLLAIFCVLLVAVTAAGIGRLDQVAPSGPDAGTLGTAVRTGKAYVATKPVAPRVREVSAAVPAEPRRVRKAGLRLVETSAPQRVTGYATVGVTWNEDDAIAEDAVRFEVRTKRTASAEWSAWEKVEYHGDHGPNQAEGDGNRTLRQGTEPDVVGNVARVRFRVFSATGRSPRGMRWVLIDPGRDRVVKQAPAIDTADPAGRRLTKSGISLAAMKVAPKPKIYSRAQWGADERLREPGKPLYGTIQTGFVHHTVNANDYTAAQVPALLRSIYAFHTVSRGWRDIGYNFLVDRFGKIWEGRYGGVDKAVVGAHTSGYNDVAFAMSAIGNFEIAKPPEAVVRAYAQVFAWKLSMYGIKADASGLTVHGRTLQAINGHRNVGQTACPGRYLYARVPDIRTMAAKIQRTGAAPTPTPTPTPPPTPRPDARMPVPAADLPARSSLTGTPWPDLVVRARSTGRVFVVPTLGGARTSAPVTTPGAWGTLDLALPVGDVTGDGRADLLVRYARSGNAYVRAGTTPGLVGGLAHQTTALRTYRWIASAGDLDGDGRPDLVAGTGTKVVLLRGTGRGTFGAAGTLLTSDPGRLVGVGDLTGDGRADLVGLRSGSLLLYRGSSARAVSAPATLGAAPTGTTSLVGAGDLTGDGVGDLAVRISGVVRVLPGVRGRGFAAPLAFASPLTGATLAGFGPAVGTTSGAPALSGITGSRFRTATSDGRGTMAAPVDSGLTVPDARQLLSVGDWTGDGAADLVVRSQDGNRLTLYRGDGKGHLGSPSTLGTTFGAVSSLSAVGDVTGDGRPDLVGRKTGSLIVWPGDGRSGFQRAFTPKAAIRSYNQVGSGTWTASVTGNRVPASDGSFVPYVGTTGATLLGTRYDWVVAHGDANGDGIPDLIARGAASGTLYLFPGTATGLGPREVLGGGYDAYDLGG